MAEISKDTIDAKLDELGVENARARREVHTIVGLFKNRVGENCWGEVALAFRPDVEDLQKCREAAWSLLDLTEE